MGKTRGVHETTPELRNRMVGMYEAGLGLREIAVAVNCSQRTVKRWLNRFEKEGTVETRERCGRRRVTTSEQDEAIVRLAMQIPITAAKAVLPALGLTCSTDTIRERLHKAGIHNWSPPRKYMRRIPLGDKDGAAIQQPVWRPTGTQLGKKKSGKDSSRNEKNVIGSRKKNPPRKVRARDLYIGDGAPVAVKRCTESQEFAYSEQNACQSETAEVQLPPQHLPSQIEFGNVLNLAHQPQPIYQHGHSSISQDWPLDLVQGNHQYPQGQPNAISHEQAAPAQQLQIVHAEPKQELEQQQQQQQQQLNQQQQQLNQQQLNQQQLNQQQQQIAVQQADGTPLSSDNCNARTPTGPLASMESVRKRLALKEDDTKSKLQAKKKKGGKAKGTLETSVEIRNRMIGMSEAGLSTLSIALAIDRSERTVKRWLERWRREGNVQTKERKGRRRITTKEQDEAIVAMATQQPLTAAKHVAPALGLKCSVDTIRERLHRAGIHSWKLGKKQGEGNAVHTVHLWQPSGNRPNKPKLPGVKKEKPGSRRKRDQAAKSTQKRLPTKKRKVQPASEKPVAIANVLPQPLAGLFYHHSQAVASCVSGATIMQPVENIGGPGGGTMVHSESHPPAAPPAASHAIQPIDSMMQQRADCRLAPATVMPVPAQPNTGVAYSSCMVATTTNTEHMEQSDPLNYEPYIWSF